MKSQRLIVSEVVLLVVLTTWTLSLSGAESAHQPEPVAKMTLGRPIALADSGKRLVHILDASGNLLWQYPAKKPPEFCVYAVRTPLTTPIA